MDMLSIDELITIKKDLLSKPTPTEDIFSQLKVNKSSKQEHLNEFKL